jgi:hypothetical protein
MQRPAGAALFLLSNNGHIFLTRFGIQNDFSNLCAGSFPGAIASSLCKEDQTVCFACGRDSPMVLFHKLFNTTVEITAGL